MVVFQGRHLVGKAEGGGELDLIVGLVLPVPAPALGRDEAGRGKGPLPRDLGHIVGDAVFIAVIRGLKLAVLFHLQPEGDPGVDHGLLVQNVTEIFLGNVDIREHFPVRPPADGGAGFFPVGRLRHQLLALFAAYLALFEVKLILLSVPPDGHVHVFRGVLGGAGAQTVKAQGVFVVSPVGILVFAAGVQLAEHQLPVEALLVGVPVHRAATAEVLHLNGAVGKACQGDQVAVALSGLVNGVGQYFKYGVLTAVQPVGAENDARALSYPVRAFQLGNAVVAVLGGAFAHKM